MHVWHTRTWSMNGAAVDTYEDSLDAGAIPPNLTLQPSVWCTEAQLATLHTHLTSVQDPDFFMATVRVLVRPSPLSLLPMMEKGCHCQRLMVGSIRNRSWTGHLENSCTTGTHLSGQNVMLHITARRLHNGLSRR